MKPAVRYSTLPMGYSITDSRGPLRWTARPFPSADHSAPITSLETVRGDPPFNGTRERLPPRSMATGPNEIKASSDEGDTLVTNTCRYPSCRDSGLTEL